jgi:hypothetical protein
MLEILGYVASVLVAVSLMMRLLVKLRIINLIGAVCFTVYGLLIHAYPVMGVNLFIVGINLYYLVEMFTQKEYFTILEVHASSEYLQRFLTFYAAEIQRFIPDFAFTSADRQIIFFVLRNMVPAGLFIAQAEGESVLRVQLDFVIPGYRDYQIGRFVFSKAVDVFKSKGFHQLISSPGQPAHTKYLRKMGFTLTTDAANQPQYVKNC